MIDILVQPGAWRRVVPVAVGILELAFAPFGAAAQQAEPPATVTLEQATALAFQHNPQVVQAAGTVSTSRAAERTAFGAYLPSLSVNAGTSLAGSNQFGSQVGSISTGTSDSYSAGLSAAWDVYDPGRGAERTQAKAQTQAAQADVVAQRAGVSLSVEQSFYAVLRAEDLIGVAQSRIQRAQEGVDAAQKRLTVGSATRSDVLRAQLELNTAQSALLEAQTQRDAARLALGRLVGADGPVGAQRAGDVSPKPLAMTDEQLIASLVSQAPAIQAAQAASRAAEAGTAAARSQYLPSLRLTTGYNWANQDPAFSDSRGSWSLGLGISYPVFNGFQREETSVRAQAQQVTAEAQLADAARQVRSQAGSALGQLHLSEEKIRLAEQALQTSREDLRVQQERYRLGASTILDLLSSQGAVVEAENNLVAARYDYQLARAQLEALAGREL
ncbi:MAG: TolC family protein [Gemmatimonadetes bacterium]|nr:TolC family protein [Gemmatimonadota bacterium]